MDETSRDAAAGPLTTRDVCQELGLTYRALRVYEEKGLIAPTRQERRHLFHAKDVERLRKIVMLKTFGLTLREIRELLRSPADGPFGLTANMCKKAFKQLSAQRAEAEAGLALLAEGGCLCHRLNPNEEAGAELIEQAH